MKALFTLFSLPFFLLFQFTDVAAQTTAPAKVKTKTKTTQAVPKKQEAPKVYICAGGSAYAYHSSQSCSGLNRCSHTISAVSVSEAENSYSRRPCKKCY